MFLAVCVTILAPCLAQGPMVLDPRFNQPNMNPPNIQQPPNNVQQIPIANQNPQPMPAANQPQAIPVVPNQNSNSQAIPVMPNPNRQPIPVANQQPGQNAPGMGQGGQTPQPQLTPEEQSQITCAQVIVLVGTSKSLGRKNKTILLPHLRIPQMPNPAGILGLRLVYTNLF